jgi:hypothetical protein
VKSVTEPGQGPQEAASFFWSRVQNHKSNFVIIFFGFAHDKLKERVLESGARAGVVTFSNQHFLGLCVDKKIEREKSVNSLFKREVLFSHFNRAGRGI